MTSQGTVPEETAAPAATAGPGGPVAPAGLVAAATESVRGLAGVDWTRVDRDGLVPVLVGVERLRSVLDAVTVDLVGRIEATRAGAQGRGVPGDSRRAGVTR